VRPCRCKPLFSKYEGKLLLCPWFFFCLLSMGGKTYKPPTPVWGVFVFFVPPQCGVPLKPKVHPGLTGRQGFPLFFLVFFLGLPPQPPPPFFFAPNQRGDYFFGGCSALKPTPRFVFFFGVLPGGGGFWGGGAPRTRVGFTLGFLCSPHQFVFLFGPTGIGTKKIGVLYLDLF